MAKIGMKYVIKYRYKDREDIKDRTYSTTTYTDKRLVRIKLRDLQEEHPSIMFWVDNVGKEVYVPIAT